MKHLTLIPLLSVLITASAATGSEADWLINYEDALAKAKAENKPILIDFTGSDWCGWCVKLDKETFSKSEFQDFARDHLILLELDFPQSKDQDASIKEQNSKLKNQYGVQGFPTLVLLSPQGKELARNPGFLPGGPGAIIDWVKSHTN